MAKIPTHVIGFDDAPFEQTHRGDVLVVGAAYAGNRLDGVLSTKVRRDGVNSTRALIDRVRDSRFHAHNQAIFLQGIALGGFNVIDVHALHLALNVPVIVVMRRRPNLIAIRRALLEHVPGGKRKWQLIEKAGPVEAVAGMYVQHIGLTLSDAERLIKRFAFHSIVPEPLRTAHLIAGGVTVGQSTGRV